MNWKAWSYDGSREAFYQRLRTGKAEALNHIPLTPLRWRTTIFAALAICAAIPTFGQQNNPSPNAIAIEWEKSIIVSKSTPTLQVVVNPMLRRGSPIHDASFAAVKKLGADYVRYVPWLPYPKLAVAELQPPTAAGTSWDFSLIDPMTADFMAATEGHSTVMNFSTIPAWLFKTDKPVTYPADPDQVYWKYTQGDELRDPSGKELGDYYARLVSWYTRGSLTDENGKVHVSGHHYHFPIWEVLNEVDFEHKMTPAQYTARYDAIVMAIRAVSPETKFMGMALAQPSDDPAWFEYFLNHRHHLPGIPIDYISYHFYATPGPDQTIDNWQYTFFDQAERFLTTVRYVEQIRKRLSPATKTDTDELGVILPDEFADSAHPGAMTKKIPARYWDLAGSLYAHLFIQLSRLGVDVIGESQLVGYPSQFPSVTMIDWTDGKPNARYWVLKLLKDNFSPGDVLVDTQPSKNGLDAQAFATTNGRKILLVNERNRATEVALPKDIRRAKVQTVDEASGEGPARFSNWSGEKIHLAPFAVAVVTPLP